MRPIDADKLLKDIEHYHLSDGCFQHWVEVQPTIEEHKKGKWIDDRGLYMCSSCGKLWTYWWARVVPLNQMCEELKYCPMCGADMRGEQDVETN